MNSQSRGTYYNEFDPYAAAWLRNLIAAGHIPAGEVDERSIVDVGPDDLAGFRQCHFFAGIGGWALAARLAGWPDDREIWTGSPPCQPFSVAGKQLGQDDERHLWPHYFRLISGRRPLVVMGEQVAAAVGKDWFDGVCLDLSAQGYACRGAIIPACAVNAPHRRDRLWFVAGRGESVDHRVGEGLEGFAWDGHGPAGWQESNRSVAEAGSGGNVADGDHAEWRASMARWNKPDREAAGWNKGDCDAGECGASLVGDAYGFACRQGHPLAGGCEDGSGAGEISGPVRAGGGAMADRNGLGSQPGNHGEAAGHREAAASSDRQDAWNNAAWIIGHDGKARRVEPGIRLLAHGVPARVGKLRAYGNAIVPQVAAEVIGAYLDCRP